MNLDWVGGFIEGNGSFSIGFIKSSSTKLKYQIKPVFVLKIPKSEMAVLEKVRGFFGGIGNIYYDMGENVSFRVTKLDEVKNIVNLLKNARFVSENKKRDFENWVRCIRLIEKKEHLTKDGFLKIALIRDAIHKKQLWNKKNYCVIKNNVDPCEIYLKEKKIPDNCGICKGC